VRNWPSKGAFPLRPLDIDVNPLVVAGALGELIDPRLVNRQPIRDTELLANACLQIIEIEFLGFHVRAPVRVIKGQSPGQLSHRCVRLGAFVSDEGAQPGDSG
jgi:hypothetical protein